MSMQIRICHRAENKRLPRPTVDLYCIQIDSFLIHVDWTALVGGGL